jgi:hypothetical protein
MIPPPPKGAPAAVLDPAPEIVIFLNYYDKNYQPTVQSFPRISSAGRHSGGAAAPGNVGDPEGVFNGKI